MNDGSDKILILEDEPACHKVMKNWLSRAGFQVTVAETAIDALYCARLQQFDLIIVDYYLPDYPGTDFLKLLRGMGCYERTPVILVTARADELDEQWLLRELKALLIPKPCYLPRLCDLVNICLAIAHDSDVNESSQSGSV